MDRDYLILAIFFMALFVPAFSYYDMQIIKNNDAIFMDNNVYVCRDGILYTENIVLHIRMWLPKYQKVENVFDIPAICVGDKIYKMGE